jgi:HD-like signal output (HDOD) protein
MKIVDGRASDRRPLAHAPSFRADMSGEGGSAPGVPASVRRRRGGIVIDLQALTRSANNLEALPASVTRLATIAAGDNWDVREVEQTIALDQALSLRLLRAANSAASAARMPIVTIRDAIVRVGLGSVLSLATASSVHGKLTRAIPEYGLSEGEMWRHAVGAALAAESAQSFCEASLPPETYAAALLHDIGKLVLARFLEPEVLRVLALAREEGHMSSLSAETELLTVHHGELGGLIAQHWQLPPRLVTGIIHHHTPELAGDVTADVVHVANIVAKHVGAGHYTDEDDRRPHPDSLERLKLTDKGFESLCKQVEKRLEQVLAQYAQV